MCSPVDMRDLKSFGHSTNRFGEPDQMRLAIYIRSVKTARGTERVVYNLAKGLAQLGHKVDFLVEDDRGWIIEDLQHQGGNLTVVPLWSSLPVRAANGFWKLLSVAKNLLAAPVLLRAGQDACVRPVLRVIARQRSPLFPLFRYIRRYRPDAVLSFLNYPSLNLLLTAQIFRSHTRYVVNVRNHISTAVSNAESYHMRMFPRLMRRFFPLADLIIANSTEIARDITHITGIPAEHLKVIHNPVYRPEIETLAAEATIHPWLNDDRVPVILGVGKFKIQKDFETLMRAFALVRHDREARLIILGDGPLDQILSNLAEELGLAQDIDFPGHVRNPFPYFSRASVFVSSSAWEGLPNAVIEALACGCPVVSTDCPGGSAEVLGQGTYGRLVPVGDEKTMADAILSSLTAPPSRAMLTDRAKAFSVEQACIGYEQAIRDLCGFAADPCQNVV